ncbi:MAG: hypothetical protein HYR84_14455 [Planctomycetes bacterium]|nr:hypothetical protein [Planctomycetota bacterium]
MARTFGKIAIAAALVFGFASASALAYPTYYVTEFQIWGKDSRAVALHHGRDSPAIPYLRIATEPTRTSAQQVVAMIMRHGDFTFLQIREVRVRRDFLVYQAARTRLGYPATRILVTEAGRIGSRK